MGEPGIGGQDGKTGAKVADFKPFRQISLKQLKEVLYIISRLTVMKVKNMKGIYIPATERTSGVSYQLCKR